MSEYKDIRLVDLNLVSGSTESFRTATAYVWTQTSESATGEQLEWPGMQAFGGAVVPILGQNSLLLAELNLKETTSADVILPNYRIPMRLKGDKGRISNDEEWKDEVLNVYSAGTFDDHAFTYKIPYSVIEAKNLDELDAATNSRNTIKCGYKYNYYLGEYEEHIANLGSELGIPNLYLLEMARPSPDDQADALVGVDGDIKDFVTLGGAVSSEALYSLFENVSTTIFPAQEIINQNITSYELGSGEYADRLYNIKQYLTGAYITSSYDLSSVTEKLQNIVFPDDLMVIAGAAAADTANIFLVEGHNKFPFYTTIEIPTSNLWQTSNTNSDKQTLLRDAIRKNKFSPTFVRMLKEVYLNENNTVAPADLAFAVAASYESGSIEEGVTLAADVSSVISTTVRSVDLMKMLAYYSANYDPSSVSNFYTIGSASYGDLESINAAIDEEEVYRYNNTIGIAHILNTIVSQTYTSAGGNPYEGEDYQIDDLSNLYEQAGYPKYNETIVYRIEKIGGVATGDSLTQNVLQNFWLFNSRELNENIKFYDSQVKYGENYTYRIYAYVAVIGHKYNFSDLAISRRIGDATDQADGWYCLEFYNPATGKSTSQLYDINNELMDNNEYATNAQITTDEKYLADFYLNYEPIVKMLEIPIFEKTLRVLDNPSVALDVSPFQYLDDSHNIGFILSVDTSRFTDAASTLPTPITPEDVTLFKSYANANNLLPGEEVPIDSVTKIDRIQVYRLTEKPTAITDFANNLRKTIDLRIENNDFMVSKHKFVERIVPNKKYYYLFRGLNEHSIPTHLSPIYEAELVNDGGYLYARFDTIYEEALEEKLFVNPLTTFKKLFQLKPNMSHLILDESELDYSDTAANNLTNGNLIVGTAMDTLWDKTFKIRLTSKKTGKKIDLNVTYRLNTE